MTLEVPGRNAARCLPALVLSLAAILAVHPAEARTHAAHPHAAKYRAAVAKRVTISPHARKAQGKHVVAQHHAKRVVAQRHTAPAVARDEGAGPLRVSADMAYVVDQQTGQVLYGKNASEVHPIASLTKLMTGMIIARAQLPMDDKITISDADVDRLKFSSSRLKVGTVLTREQALHLALMSSENRAAHALARTYPGGESAFVSAMNGMAAQLGMEQTRYVEPTGLSSGNQSTAHDLAVLTAAATQQPLLHRYTTSPGYRLATEKGTLQYVNTNRLVRSGQWDIGIQKTGFINEAGPTMLMQAKLAGRKLIMVFLDSATKVARFTDAERVRAWLRHHPQVLANEKGQGAPG